MKFTKNQSAGYLANHMARVFEQALNKKIKPLGLTTGTFPALLELWENDELTQKQLVERLNIEQATMAITLKRMQRDGLIERKKHPHDARAQLVCLTQKASDLQQPAIRAAHEVNAKALQGLTEEQRAIFLKLMLSVIANFAD